MGADFGRNNLDMADSPYLRQHALNPIHWQEWNNEVLEYARSSGKPIFLSIGYSSCHWCHVMASEAFSDQHTAYYLNTHFISIKVDREQRPDIDRVMMDFLVSISGNGGWPLNVFLSSEAVPFFAFTYAPLVESYGIRSFREISELAYSFYIENSKELENYSIETLDAANADDAELVQSIEKYYDHEYGGFGQGQKFPNYCTILFMIYAAAGFKGFTAIVEHTLDSISKGGLHDHIQGGFFRYTVDREWKIPHFEKMLYDQAMLLWVFSLAFRLVKNDIYRTVAERIVKCIDETFYKNGGYISAHDADTEHQEGATYIWTIEELGSFLAPEEFIHLSERYHLPEKGNFEGKIHLVKKNESIPDRLEEKLLTYRKKRSQPSVDEKIITSWNAFLGVALVEAFRAFGDKSFLQRAVDLYAFLKSFHFKNGFLSHSSINGKVQREGFLEDASSMLLFATYLYEEDKGYSEDVDDLISAVKKFNVDGTVYESVLSDFRMVPAERSDRPLPSSLGVAELAESRIDFLNHNEKYSADKFFDPFLSGFSNISILQRRSEFYIYTSPDPVDWKGLPPSSIRRRGDISNVCFRHVCRDISE